MIYAEFKSRLAELLLMRVDKNVNGGLDRSARAFSGPSPC